MRRVIAALVVVGLAVAIVLFWPRSEPDDPPGTVAVESTSTTTSTSVASTTTTGGGTTSTSEGDGSHVVETVEEAEAILWKLWFGWFEGTYNQDVERMREVVALDETVDDAVAHFGEDDFERAPQPSDISFSNTEILRTNATCLAVWTEMTLTGFRDGSSGSVHVLRFVDGSWKRLSLWPLREDPEWEADCDSQLLSH